MNSVILVAFVAVVAVVYVDAHGRMWEPPGRGTEWRRGYAVPEEKKDYNDMEGYCGGKTVSNVRGNTVYPLCILIFLRGTASLTKN